MTKGKILKTDIDSQGRFVFRVSQKDESLFRAAPDMHEALQIALDETPGFMLGEDVKQKMRQALAKAKGRKS